MSCAEDRPHVTVALEYLGPAEVDRFIAEYARFAAVSWPGTVVDRALAVTVVKAWTGDPLLPAWEALVLDLDDRTRFAQLVAGLE